MTSQFVVEDKPVTPRKLVRGRLYPFNEMKVGQSFAVSSSDYNRVMSAAYAYGKKHGLKFAFERDGDNYRCGRVA
jgi:hypothetical protein